MTRPTFSYSTEGPECPYCETQFTADDSSFYDENYTEDTCPECGETFLVEVHVETSWTCFTKLPEPESK